MQGVLISQNSLCIFQQTSCWYRVWEQSNHLSKSVLSSYILLQNSPELISNVSLQNFCNEVCKLTRACIQSFICFINFSDTILWVPSSSTHRISISAVEECTFMIIFCCIFVLQRKQHYTLKIQGLTAQCSSNIRTQFSHTQFSQGKPYWDLQHRQEIQVVLHWIADHQFLNLWRLSQWISVKNFLDPLRHCLKKFFRWFLIILMKLICSIISVNSSKTRDLHSLTW